MFQAERNVYFCLRLVDLNVADRDPCKQKKKTKERKELWDSLLEVYEKEVRNFVLSYH